jgi:hypothetical protein
MGNNEPERKIRKVVDACADCDICRYLMETTCLLFPELYRLYDRKVEDEEKGDYVEVEIDQNQTVLSRSCFIGMFTQFVIITILS